jgi:hypothetical protein
MQSSLSMDTTNHPVPHDGANPSSTARAPHLWQHGEPFNHGELNSFLNCIRHCAFGCGSCCQQHCGNVLAAAAALLLHMCRQQRQLRVSADQTRAVQ